MRASVPIARHNVEMLDLVSTVIASALLFTYGLNEQSNIQTNNNKNMIKEIIEDIKGAFIQIPYTYKHYKAFRKIEKELTGANRHWHHDWDKLIACVICPWIGIRRIHQWHQKRNSHHPTYTVGKEWKKFEKYPLKIDWEEAIIDWECARFTKPDKPLNAYDTLMKYYKEYEKYAMPTIKKFNLIPSIGNKTN